MVLRRLRHKGENSSGSALQLPGRWLQLPRSWIKPWQPQPGLPHILYCSWMHRNRSPSGFELVLWEGRGLCLEKTRSLWHRVWLVSMSIIHWRFGVDVVPSLLSSDWERFVIWYDKDPSSGMWSAEKLSMSQHGGYQTKQWNDIETTLSWVPFSFLVYTRSQPTRADTPKHPLLIPRTADFCQVKIIQKSSSLGTSTLILTNSIPPI